MSVNKAILIGNLGKGPELKHTPSGQAVCSFSLATNERYTDKSGQKQSKTEWHNIVAWGRTGETLSEYLHKGDNIYIEGKITTRSWENKEGQIVYRTEIVVNKFSFINSKNSGSDFDNGEPYSQPSAVHQEQEEDLLF